METCYLLISWHSGEEFSTKDLPTLYSKLEDIRGQETASGWYKLLKSECYDRDGTTRYFKENPIKETEDVKTVDDLKEIILDWYEEETDKMVNNVPIKVYPWVEGRQYEVTFHFPEKLNVEFATDFVERTIKKNAYTNPSKTVSSVLDELKRNQPEVAIDYVEEAGVEVVYDGFINSLKTKLAQHSAKKTLEKTTEFNGVDMDIKGVIYYYLTRDGYNLFYKIEEKGESYFIGDTTGSVIDLNKTMFNFAKYIMSVGVAHPNNSTYDYDRYEKSKKAGEDWFDHVSKTKLTSVLLRDTNFENYNDLIAYIEGVKQDSKGYSEIFMAYDREMKMLDIYDEVARIKRSKYVNFGSLTFILLDIFKAKSPSQLSESEVKRLIDERFVEIINRQANK